MEEIESIRSWLSQETKTSTKAVAKPRIKQGYRALFNGPATNNKIATAEILGKEFNKKIYRIVRAAGGMLGTAKLNDIAYFFVIVSSDDLRTILVGMSFTKATSNDVLPDIAAFALTAPQIESAKLILPIFSLSMFIVSK